MEYISASALKKIYKPRPADSHKYDFGYLIVIGGSGFYTGAPALAAMAALRAGVDLSLVIAPERAANIVASFSPNLIAYPVKTHDLRRENLPTLLSLTEGAKKISKGKVAVLIGGGIGRDKETQKLVQEYLSRIDVPAVVDADAIWAVSEHYPPAPKKEIIRKKNFVLTPHNYEFFILSGIDISTFKLEEKIEIVRNFAKELEIIILLKGDIDIISDGTKVFLNKTGCPEMTVGGAGDTLAGLCGGFLSQGIDSILAANAAAYINGKAGELAKEKFGPGLLATDIIECIPNVAKQIIGTHGHPASPVR